MPKILIHYPDGTSAKFGLNGKSFTIGRADNNDIVLRDGSSSSYHAVLKLTESGEFTVSDLESTNHTRVNGQIIASAALTDGDVIQFGDTRAVYESGAPARDDQATQAYERTAPVAVAAQPPPRPAPAYAVQRPVSTLRRRQSGDGCFSFIALALVLPVVFVIGATVRHYQDHKRQWFWDYVKEFVHADAPSGSR